jgi:hypothetical protein
LVGQKIKGYRLRIPVTGVRKAYIQLQSVEILNTILVSQFFGRFLAVDGIVIGYGN